MYNTRTATVTVSYTDTLTEGGRGEIGSTCTVHDSYCVLHRYSDTGGGGGVGEGVAVHVQYKTVIVSYTDTLTGGGGVGERVAVHVQYTTVIVSYTDTLTEGGGGW